MQSFSRYRFPFFGSLLAVSLHLGNVPDCSLYSVFCWAGQQGVMGRALQCPCVLGKVLKKKKKNRQHCISFIFGAGRVGSS